ncbi:MAG: potassium channel family protein, partial [Duncaniella sp.]|nr:potassium channel family protein [Duncaniella sp.]
MNILHHLSARIRHYFHVVSNIRPIVWIGLYICLVPVFALIYSWLPDGQFRIPDGGYTDFGSWLYYSIVTITTLGFGDYTPAHGLAQAVTAIEVMCGLIFLGFFLNAVGSMKSEIDLESEAEKQRLLHTKQETEKLRLTVPSIIHNLNTYLSYCYAVTTPLSKRDGENASFNPDFTFQDMADLYKPSGLPSDRTTLP